MVRDCIFCKIIAGEIPADIVFQNEEFIAFRDIKPIAPVHILGIAEGENISARGYRLVTNCGAEGGQLVPHLHFHLLGGRQLNNQLG
jgi:histidine triad (HIT) family protein